MRRERRLREILTFLAPVLCAVLTAGGPAVGAALASDFPITIAGDSLSILIHADVGPEILPDFVRERLDRGIPATIGFQVDLWRNRSAWFDSRVAQEVHRYRISRDAWTGAYVLEGPEGPDAAMGADSLGTLVRRLGDDPIRLNIPRELALGGAVLWVEVTAVTIPLSVQDLGEVEEWITGEMGGGSNSVFGIPGGVLRMVRDLSGLGDRRLVGQTGRFGISLVAGDVVWVQTLGRSP